MPRKIRELVADLQATGFVVVPGGKGSHRKFRHPRFPGSVILSGKAGVVIRARENGNVYVSYGTTVTPPGAANFTLSAAANNQNNPNVKPQESSNVEVGTKWDVAGRRLSLNGGRLSPRVPPTRTMAAAARKATLR